MLGEKWIAKEGREEVSVGKDVQKHHGGRFNSTAGRWDTMGLCRLVRDRGSSGDF